MESFDLFKFNVSILLSFEVCSECCL